MNIIIIGHNEGASVQKMLASLCVLVPNSKRIWVLDRCTDDSKKQLIKMNEFYIETPKQLKGRQTSYARNLGLKYTDITKDVLILDGDRFPVTDSLKTLGPLSTDIELLLLENDHRDNMLFNKAYGSVHNGFYSCGIFIKRKAINKILIFQNGWLFNEDIQKDWGIEDVYLGDVCYHLGLTCALNTVCRLHGYFEKTSTESIDVIEQRFKLRDKLNVKW